MKKLLVVIIAGFVSVNLFADTSVVTKKVNETYTKNPKLHEKVENTRGNKSGYYEAKGNHPQQVIQQKQKAAETKVTTDTSVKQSNLSSH